VRVRKAILPVAAKGGGALLQEGETAAFRIWNCKIDIFVGPHYTCHPE
jgi:hypothetical protein